MKERCGGPSAVEREKYGEIKGKKEEKEERDKSGGKVEFVNEARHFGRRGKT